MDSLFWYIPSRVQTTLFSFIKIIELILMLCFLRYFQIIYIYSLLCKWDSRWFSGVMVSDSDMGGEPVNLGSIPNIDQMLPILTLGRLTNAIAYLGEWAYNNPLPIINKEKRRRKRYANKVNIIAFIINAQNLLFITYSYEILLIL